MSNRGNTDNILGWNAPHVHFTASQLAASTEVEEPAELSAYEQYLKSIGMLRQHVVGR